MITKILNSLEHSTKHFGCMPSFHDFFPRFLYRDGVDIFIGTHVSEFFLWYIPLASPSLIFSEERFGDLHMYSGSQAVHNGIYILHLRFDLNSDRIVGAMVCILHGIEPSSWVSGRDRVATNPRQINRSQLDLRRIHPPSITCQSLKIVIVFERH